MPDGIKELRRVLSMDLKMTIEKKDVKAINKQEKTLEDIILSINYEYLKLL